MHGKVLSYGALRGVKGSLNMSARPCYLSRYLAPESGNMSV